MPDQIDTDMDDQKDRPTDQTTEMVGESSVDKDDPHKAEKLTKAGRDKDPDEGSD